MTLSPAPLTVGIDATGIRSGGGLAHLVELLRAANPQSAGINHVVLFAGKAANDAVPQKPFLTKVYCPELDFGLVKRVLWQLNILPNLATKFGCQVIFVPGGTSVTPFRPIVSMSQNMLPFQLEEAWRYGLSKTFLRLLILRRTQTATMSRSGGYIFLTEFARNQIRKIVKNKKYFEKSVVVPHGVSERFRMQPQQPISLEDCSNHRPFKILYVSIVDVYKHQWNVAEAVALLGQKGYPIQLELVGPYYPPAQARLDAALKCIDPQGRWIRCFGGVPNEKLHHCYEGADLVVFASSCENLPIILLEAMASGKPIACSNRGPMPEVLGPNGQYFDPEDPVSIAACIERLIQDLNLRRISAQDSYERASLYTWERCASETFSYLGQIAKTRIS